MRLLHRLRACRGPQPCTTLVVTNRASRSNKSKGIRPVNTSQSPLICSRRCPVLPESGIRRRDRMLTCTLQATGAGTEYSTTATTTATGTAAMIEWVDD